MSMQEASDSSVQRLLASISEPSTRSMVGMLLKNSIQALRLLSGLDDTIYQCYKLDDTDGEFNAELDLTITELRSRIFGGTRGLLEFLKRNGWLSSPEIVDPFASQDEVNLEITLDDDFDIAFGDDFDAAFSEAKAARSSPSLPSLPDLRDIDIDEAFDFLEPEDERTSQEKLDQLREELLPLCQTLENQLNTFEYRLRTAFHQANYSLVIRELDTCRESLTEGLLAFVSSIFREFSSDAVPLATLPGYRDNLAQALQVRSGLSRLTRATNLANSVVQDDNRDKEARIEGVQLVADLLNDFIESETFHAMQPPDRWEMVNFSRNLKTDRFRAASQTAEGFAKYLDSLAMMAPNDILHQYDTDTIAGINSLLGAVRSLVMVSPAGAIEMLEDALQMCHSLYGRDLYIDKQLDAWDEYPPDLKDGPQRNRVIEKIEMLLR